MVDEIERKWLVDKIPFDLNQFDSSEINQAYLGVVDFDNDEIRLRKKKNKYLMTIKKGAGEKRGEAEVEITGEVYKQISSLQNLNWIKKIRYEIPEGKNIIEFDIYHGDLEGLLTAEVEFESLEEEKSYVPKNWFGREVTFDKCYKNKYLARDGFPKN